MIAAIASPPITTILIGSPMIPVSLFTVLFNALNADADEVDPEVFVELLFVVDEVCEVSV